MSRSRRLKIVLLYNGADGSAPELVEDRGSCADLRAMIQQMARALRSLGHSVTVVALEYDLPAFQRRLRRLAPDVVFNQYEDVMHGALYEMQVAALIHMMGFPITGSPPVALGLYRYKGMAANLLQGAGVPVPDQTTLVERVKELGHRKWVFPLIAQPSQEHAGIGLDRHSILASRKALHDKVSALLRTFRQPALVQSFLPGREFNVSLLGGHRMQVLPLAEVDYSRLPPDIPPIMSYAAKFIETSAEYEMTSVICPAQVEPELARQINLTSLRAFRAVGGWGYGRIDIRLDGEGKPRVLEVNCNPCLEKGVALARSAERAGIPYPELLEAIVRAALEHHRFSAAASPFPFIRPLPQTNSGKKDSLTDAQSGG